MNTLRVFKSSELKIVFGPKREEIIRGSRGSPNEQPHDLYLSPSFG
jgi:hypothetical protein